MLLVLLMLLVLQSTLTLTVNHSELIATISRLVILPLIISREDLSWSQAGH